MGLPNEAFEMRCGALKTHTMTEAEYIAGVKIVGKRLGVENPFDHPEFMRDLERYEPHMVVRSKSRSPKVSLQRDGISVTRSTGRMTRFGRASFSKCY